MTPQTGLLLRLVGPLIEILAAVAYVRFGNRGLTYAGVPVDTLCFAAFGVGLALVVIGLSMTLRRRRGPDPSRFDIDLGPEDPEPDDRAGVPS